MIGSYIKQDVIRNYTSCHASSSHCCNWYLGQVSKSEEISFQASSLCKFIYIVCLEEGYTIIISEQIDKGKNIYKNCYQTCHIVYPGSHNFTDQFWSKMLR